MHNPVKYTRTDFDVLGIMQPADKNTTSRVNFGAKFKTEDIDKIRKHCNPLEKVFSDIENGSAQGEVGHKQRIVAANIIKNTVNDEKYLLDKFKNLHDFDLDTSLKHYKSINKAPVSCDKMQEWGLCPGKCQLMKDIEMKSPIAFAYRKGVELETSEQLIRNIDPTGERTDEFDELRKRIKMTQNPMKVNNLKSEIRRVANLSQSELNAALKDYQVVDNEKPYLVNGMMDVMKAAEYMVGNLHIIHYQGETFQYDDGIWKKKTEAWLEAQIHHLLKSDASTETISRVIKTVIRESYLAPEKVDYEQSKNLIAAANGLFDIATGDFRPFVPDDYVFRKLQVDYEPNATASEFDKFLNELFSGDTDAKEKIKALQELSGYILLADYSLLKLMFYFYGPSANNGKSTFLEIMQAMLGNDMYTSIPLDQLQGSMLSHLHGKHVNVVGDLHANTKVPDGILKQLVGGKDLITADRKYLQPLQFINTARLIYAVNRLPFSQAKDKGYFTRVAVISFNNEFVVNPDKNNARQFKADPRRIQTILNDELSGVLNWAIEGLKRFLANGEMTIPDSSRQIVAKYQVENNSVMSFVDECCELKPGPPVNRTHIYKAYENWCKLSGIRHKVGAATFYNTLKDEYGILTERTEGSRNLVGISLNDNYMSNYRLINDRNDRLFV
jgi:P4 family phage/plasmid primase-like protien